jgi:hypothetical protein
VKLLDRLPWSKRARFHRKIRRIAREMQGVPYCWPPQSDGTDCSSFLPPPEWRPLP